MFAARAADFVDVLDLPPARGGHGNGEEGRHAGEKRGCGGATPVETCEDAGGVGAVSE